MRTTVIGNPEFDLKAYQGRWYEVAKSDPPIEWEKACSLSIADYKVKKQQNKLTLVIKNSCLANGKVIAITKGVGYVQSVDENEDYLARLEVHFPLNRIGEYLVCYTDYINYSIVTGSGYTWILARNPSLDLLTENKDFLVEQLLKFGINPRNMIIAKAVLTKSI